jgi:hypothetical protein
VSGLTSGTAYTFTVTATNANGTSTASAASNSVTPANPSSYESIASATGSGVDTVTFSSIPGTYKMLQLRLFLNTTSGSDSGCFMTFNGGTNSQISYARIGARGNGSAATNGSTQSSGNGVYIRTFGTATIGSPAVVDVYDYTSTNKNKTFDVRNGFVASNATDADTSYISAVFGSNSAITSITLTAQSGTFRSTNSFALYGIK